MTGSSGSVAELTTDQVLGWRMQRQLLDPIGDLDVRETVRAVAGIQAQVQSSAELGIALRRDAAAVGDTSVAIATGKIMRTWAMRGTLHLLDPVQGGALLALLATSRRWESRAWQANYGLGPAELEELIAIVRHALGGRVLTREEVIETVLDKTGSRELEAHMRSGWGGILKPLAWLGHLCNGPSQGGRVTFTRPDTWLQDGAVCRRCPRQPGLRFQPTCAPMGRPRWPPFTPGWPGAHAARPRSGAGLNTWLT